MWEEAKESDVANENKEKNVTEDMRKKHLGETRKWQKGENTSEIYRKMICTPPECLSFRLRFTF